MKIGTVNIDWFLKKLPTKQFINDVIQKEDFDFLIVTENVEKFQISENYFVYHSDKIPLDKTFEFLDYGKYLKGIQAIRTSIYSKYPSINANFVIDRFTSICHTFLVDETPITIYGTIIGTWGILHQKSIAQKELLNFIKDVEQLNFNAQNFVVAGDFNTSFFEDENREIIQINSREILKKVTDQFQIGRVTENIIKNIDHIFISKSMKCIEKSVFIYEDELGDKYHKGISVQLEFSK